MDQQEKINRAESARLNELTTVSWEARQPYVFISYKSDDWQWALEEVTYTLQKKYGLQIYYDREFATRNDSWTKIMTENIQSPYCVAVLVFLSREYFGSYATLLEVLRSQSVQQGYLRAAKPIIPIVKDGNAKKLLTCASARAMNTTRGQGITKVEWDAFQSCINDIGDLNENKVSDALKSVRQIISKVSAEEDFTARKVTSCFMKLEDLLTNNLNDYSLGDSFYSNLAETIRQCFNIFAAAYEESEDTPLPESSNLFNPSLIGPLLPQDSSDAKAPTASAPQAPKVAKPLAQPKFPEASGNNSKAANKPEEEPVPAVVSFQSSSKLSAQMTLREFQAYVADPANTPTLQAIWASTKKGPAYVMFASLLGGSGLKTPARKQFVSDIAQTTSKGKPCAGTWASEVAGYMNNSRALETIKDVYPALSADLHVQDVADMFAAGKSPAFVPTRGTKEEILAAFSAFFSSERF